MWDWISSENAELANLLAEHDAKNEARSVKEVKLLYPQGDAAFKELLGENWQTALLDILPKAFRAIPRRIEVHHHEPPKDPSVKTPLDTLGTWQTVHALTPFQQRHHGQNNDSMRLYAGILEKTDIVNTYLHELGHGIDRKPDRDFNQYRAKRIFVEAVRDERPRYSSYIAHSYRKNVERGLSEDFAESFARYFTSPVDFQALQPKRYTAMQRIVTQFYKVSAREILRLRELEGKSRAYENICGDAASLRSKLQELPNEDIERALLQHLPSYLYQPLPHILFDTQYTRVTDARRSNEFDAEGRLFKTYIAAPGGEKRCIFSDPVYDDIGRLTKFVSYEKRFNVTYQGTSRIPKNATFWHKEDTLDPASGLSIPSGIITYTKQGEDLITEQISTRFMNRSTLTEYYFQPDGSPKKTHYSLFNDQILTEIPGEILVKQSDNIHLAVNVGTPNRRVLTRIGGPQIPYRLPKTT